MLDFGRNRLLKIFLFYLCVKFVVMLILVVLARRQNVVDSLKGIPALLR